MLATEKTNHAEFKSAVGFNASYYEKIFKRGKDTQVEATLGVAKWIAHQIQSKFNQILINLIIIKFEPLQVRMKLARKIYITW